MVRFYALCLVAIQALVTHPADRVVHGAAGRLDERSEQARDDHRASRAATFRAKTATDRPNWETLRQEIGKKNCLIFLTASWCIPCRRMHPVVDGLAKDYYVYEVDIDEQSDVAKALKVSSVPTMIVMEDGKELARFVGITAKEKLTEKLKMKADQSPPDYDFR